MMKQALINVLETICPGNVYLQGTLGSEVYPTSFITFWTIDVPDLAHYDDETTSYSWTFSVIYYSSDPSLVNSVPNQIITALKAQGFIPQGKGTDISSSQPSHTGWAMEFVKIENIVKEN